MTGDGAGNTIVCDAGLTTKLTSTEAAALKFAFPPWLARTTIVPAPVTVTVFPMTLAGPLSTA